MTDIRKEHAGVSRPGFWWALLMAFVLSSVGVVVSFFAALAMADLNGTAGVFAVLSLVHIAVWTWVCVRLVRRGARDGAAGVVAGVLLMIVAAIALVAYVLANMRLGGF